MTHDNNSPSPSPAPAPPVSRDDADRSRRASYIRSLDKIQGLSDEEKQRLRPVAEKFVFRANSYYLDLIDWDDPQDPIRQLIIPQSGELNDWGKLDASDEQSVTVVRGAQHKYRETVLLLCNEVCGAYCRYCFRKRLFMDDNDEVTNDISEGLQYIAQHPEVTDVLLTGGDPLLMSDRRLGEIFAELQSIPHVTTIRIGTKLPAFDPARVLSDSLQQLLRRYSRPAKRIYLMMHFDHPRELTELAVKAIETSRRNGAICVNQCPILEGINADAAVLAEMFQKLVQAGAPPYYLFQGRPTSGNEPYALPIVRGWSIFQDALSRVSGLGRRARFVMSHKTGKLEVLGMTDEQMFLRYHQAKRPEDINQLVICRRDDQAVWFDDLVRC